MLNNFQAFDSRRGEACLLWLVRRLLWAGFGISGVRSKNDIGQASLRTSIYDGFDDVSVGCIVCADMEARIGVMIRNRLCNSGDLID